MPIRRQTGQRPRRPQAIRPVFATPVARAPTACDSNQFDVSHTASFIGMLIQDIDNQPALLHSLPYSEQDGGIKGPCENLARRRDRHCATGGDLHLSTAGPAVARSLRRIFSTVLKLLARCSRKNTEPATRTAVSCPTHRHICTHSAATMNLRPARVGSFLSPATAHAPCSRFVSNKESTSISTAARIPALHSIGKNINFSTSTTASSNALCTARNSVSKTVCASGDPACTNTSLPCRPTSRDQRCGWIWTRSPGRLGDRVRICS